MFRVIDKDFALENKLFCNFFSSNDLKSRSSLPKVRADMIRLLIQLKIINLPGTLFSLDLTPLRHGSYVDEIFFGVVFVMLVAVFIYFYFIENDEDEEDIES